MSNQLAFKNFTLDRKIFFVGLIVWIFLQISRFIAITLIDSINTGIESPAWLYPAYLDNFAAALALPLIFAIIFKRGLFTWSATVVYLAISIVDHFGNFVTTTTVGPPSIVQEGMDPLLIPIIQTVLDFVFLLLLLLPRYYKLFFRLEKR